MSFNMTNNNDNGQEPCRFILSNQDVSSIIQTLDGGAPKGKLFSDLPQNGSSLPVRLKDDNGKTKQEIKEIFSVLTSPIWSATVETFLPATGQSFSSTLAGSMNMSVMLSKEGDQWDIALLPERDQVVAVLDNLIGLTDIDSKGSSLSANLPVSAAVVLAGISDLIVKEEIVSKLERRVVSFRITSEPIVLNDVFAAVEEANNQPNLSSAVSRLAFLSNGDTAGIKTLTDSEAGATQLNALGALDEDGILTAHGLSFAMAIKNPHSVSSVTIFQAKESQTTIDRINFLCGDDYIFQGTFGGVPGATTNLILEHVSSSSALQYICDAIFKGSNTISTKQHEPKNEMKKTSQPNDVEISNATPQKFCRQCGKKLDMISKFCRSCGANIEL